MVTPLEVKKYKAKSTANAIISILKDVEVDDIINEIFIKVQNSKLETLIKIFEKQLIFSKLNEGEFKGNLYKFFKKTAIYIVKENLIKDFYKLSYDMYINLETKPIKREIVNAYLSLIMEQSSYLEGQFKSICGITENGTPIECDEIYRKLEYPIIEIMSMKDKPTNPKALFLLLKKQYKVLGYDIENEQDYHMCIANQQLISNMLFHMTYLIDEYHTDIIPEPHYLPCTGFKGDIRVLNETKLYKESLTSRKYILPHNGLICELNDIDPIKEVLLMERFLDDRVVLLYRLMMHDGNYTAGFYDINNEFFFSVWRSSDVGQVFHYKVENLVLELYSGATTNNAEIKQNLVYDNNIKFYYKYEDETNCDSKHNHIKGNYIQEITTIKPYIRKLPLGAKASKEARELAAKYGYTLDDGETFVSEFKKGVNHRLTRDK